MSAWFLSLVNFISVSGFNIRWVLNHKCASNFICGLKEPPAGHVSISLCFVMCVKNNLSLGYRIGDMQSPFFP